MKPFRLVLSQLNPTVGAFDENTAKVRHAIIQARSISADLIVFPEMILSGYPPEDLLLNPAFIRANHKALTRVMSAVRSGITAVVGYAEFGRDGAVYNSAAVLHGGKLKGAYRKRELPNYGVFDEKRYFTPGTDGLVLELGPFRIGLSICEDIWVEKSFVYRAPYAGQTSLILNMSASPYQAGKQADRIALVKRLAVQTRSAIAYTNLVGGQDELVFDGGSMILSEHGKLLFQGKRLGEDFLVCDLALRPFHEPMSHVFSESCRIVSLPLSSRSKPRLKTRRLPKKLGAPEEVYKALVLGAQDYLQKNKFRKAVIGISGGIDSALVAQIAVDALGSKNVLGVTMPSKFTSRATFQDSKRLAKNLSIPLLEIPIQGIVDSYQKSLKEAFRGTRVGLAEENIQARVRGNLLMALSNKFGYLVLTTGNKSEMATGYCTLYGDMAGGFAVIKDVPKTLVYALVKYRNMCRPRSAIPQSIVRRAPTAELRHNQKDQESLPPYNQLDRVLRQYIEEKLSVEDMAQKNKDALVVKKVVGLVDHNEYKRRQAPPGIKITSLAFGRDRRMPITNQFNA